MINDYQIQNCKILKIEDEGSDSKSFTLTAPYNGFSYVSGQYIMVSLPGFGEAPISICSDPAEKNKFTLTIRKVGNLTSKIHELKKGDFIGIRGPYGNGFPVKLAKNKNLLIIAGGIGIEPLTPLILSAVKNPSDFKKVFVFYGAKTDKDLIFRKKFLDWIKKIELFVSVDCAPKIAEIKTCSVGVVTTLFDQVDVPKDAMVFMCGPSSMCKFVIKKMQEQKFNLSNLYISLERHMDCAQGVCQHCAVGPYYVCQDGPVFSYDQIKNASWLNVI